MLVFTVLATLLCSSLIDARLAPLSTSEALDECKSQNQPSCNNPALEINQETSFHPKVNAPKDEVSLDLAVKNKEPLSFSVNAVEVKWELKRPNSCLWAVTSDEYGLVTFAEKKADGTNKATCDGETKRVVTIAVTISGTVEVSGGCNPPGNLKLACEYAAPDSGTIQDWDIWALSIRASGYSDPVPSMTFENAYVVYDAPEPPTTTSPGGSTDNTNGTDNATPDPSKSGGATTDEDHNHMMWFIIVGVTGLIILVLIVVVIVETIFIVKLKKNPGKERVKKDDLAKKGKLDADRTATVDRNCQEEGISHESKSKRLEDENKLVAAETAQNPAPAEGQPEQKSQPIQEGFNNAAAAGSGNQPAADPQKNA